MSGKVEEITDVINDRQVKIFSLSKTNGYGRERAKVFDRMFLNRTKPTIKKATCEEQHCFREGRLENNIALD